jgi:lipoprotein-anchoring transpeptidase ErfK/SrfK
MRDRSFIVVASFLGFLFAGAAGLFGYDSSRENRIAEGVRVGGVDVGEMTASAARQHLSTALRAGLTEPIVVRSPGHSFRLTPRQAGAVYDLDGMVDEAIRASRRGNIFARTWRDIRGEPVNATIPADLKYSRLVINRFVGRIDRVVTRQPVNAHLELNGDRIRRVAGEPGLDVRFPRLRDDVVAALTGTAPSRTVTVRTRRIMPKVLKAELPSAYPYLIAIDRPSFKLRYFRRLKLVKTYTIAVGQVGFDTPAGWYHIQNKAINPAWSVPKKPWAGRLAGQVIPGGTPQNPLKARWMGIYDGAGIHGTAETGSLGSAASHGCIRMAIPDVVELYEKVPVQTPVHIA